METDGIEEAFENQLRILVTAAGQVAERVARAREDTMRRAQAVSEQEAREMHARLAAEQQAARAEMANVYRSQWWDRATPEQVGHAHQVARAWSHEDPEAVRAEQRIRDEMRTRYGLDVDNLAADPAAVRAAVARSVDERAQAGAEDVKAANERAEAHQLIIAADREDRRAETLRSAAEHEPDPQDRAAALVEAEHHETMADRSREDGRAAYDSAERRAGVAQGLEAKGINQEVVATRIRADVSQAKPATQAVAARKAKVPKARKTRGVRGVQVQRTGLSR